VLRGSRGEAAGIELGSSFVERITVNAGTALVLPGCREAITGCRAGLIVGRTDRGQHRDMSGCWGGRVCGRAHSQPALLQRTAAVIRWVRTPARRIGVWMACSVRVYNKNEPNDAVRR
jgi:hypothetical protein